MNTMTQEDILNIPLFSGTAHDELLPLLKDCCLKEFHSGQFIYRYGDYGDDCGIVLSGSLRIALQHRNTPEIFIKEGDIFGEIAALSGYARTADVSASGPATALIIPKKTLLKMFDKFPSVKEQIDRIYHERVLGVQLHSTPIFMGLPKDLIEKLISKAELLSYAPGDTVFKQDAEANAFYMVRYGSVKITETGKDGSAKVLAYLKGGHYFGEMALVKDTKRMATVTAIDRTELIRILKEDFHHIIDSHPRIKTSLEKLIVKAEYRNVLIREDAFMEKTLNTAIDSGFVFSKEILVIDFTKCIHCDTCVKACGALHDNETRLIRKGARLNNILLIATSCRNCHDPSCMIKCPTGAISRAPEGEIYIRGNCIGCGMCSRNCPYGNITMVPLSDEEKTGNGLFSRYLKKPAKEETETDIAPVKKRRPKRKPVKCDMCSGYPFMACVYNCPTGAARRIDPENFFSDVMGAGQ